MFQNELHLKTEVPLYSEANRFCHPPISVTFAASSGLPASMLSPLESVSTQQPEESCLNGVGSCSSNGFHLTQSQSNVSTMVGSTRSFMIFVHCLLNYSLIFSHTAWNALCIADSLSFPSEVYSCYTLYNFQPHSLQFSTLAHLSPCILFILLTYSRYLHSHHKPTST